ncbi:hypothetical protein RCO48_35370 [Peribacillus frigoritolerans]|nr:hypothetical protein [Peribacillus frigoritolerans]
MTIILSLSLFLPSFGQTAVQQTDFKVTLLGTGSPILSTFRSGPATLVEVGDEKLLFDAGRGTALQLYKANMLPGSVDKVIPYAFAFGSYNRHTGRMAYRFFTNRREKRASI